VWKEGGRKSEEGRDGGREEAMRYVKKQVRGGKKGGKPPKN